MNPALAIAALAGLGMGLVAFWPVSTPNPAGPRTAVLQGRAIAAVRTQLDAAHLRHARITDSSRRPDGTWEVIALLQSFESPDRRVFTLVLSFDPRTGKVRNESWA